MVSTTKPADFRLQFSHHLLTVGIGGFARLADNFLGLLDSPLALGLADLLGGFLGVGDHLLGLLVGFGQHLVALGLGFGQFGLDLLGVFHALGDGFAPGLEHFQHRFVGQFLEQNRQTTKSDALGNK